MVTTQHGVLKVGQLDFYWRVFRLPTWTRGHHDQFLLLGLAILVAPPAPSQRELLLEFAIDPSRHGGMPQHQRFRLPTGRLVAAIKGVLQAGYDPGSRGKRFVHQAGALPSR